MIIFSSENVESEEFEISLLSGGIQSVLGPIIDIVGGIGSFPVAAGTQWKFEFAQMEKDWFRSVPLLGRDTPRILKQQKNKTNKLDGPDHAIALSGDRPQIGIKRMQFFARRISTSQSRAGLEEASVGGSVSGFDCVLSVLSEYGCGFAGAFSALLVELG